MMKRIGKSLLSFLLIAILVIPGVSLVTEAASSTGLYDGNVAFAFDLTDSTPKETGKKITIYGLTETNDYDPVFCIDDSCLSSLPKFSSRTCNVTVYEGANHTSSKTTLNYPGDVVLYFYGLGNYSNLTNFPHTQGAKVRITNPSESKDMLFNYYLDDGKLNPDDSTGCVVNTETSLITVRAGQTAYISLTTPMGEFNKMLFHMYNFKVVSSDLSPYVTINGAAHGTITVGDQTLAAGDSFSGSVGFDTGIALSCASVDAGYEFIGFKTDKNIYIPAGQYYPVANDVVTPIFVSTAANAPVFGVDDKIFTDFNSAVTAANSSTSKRMIVLRNGVLTAGNYTIPAGVTLLVPFDDAHTLYTNKPGTIIADKLTSRTPYSKLELASGAHLTVNGAISVSAKHPSTTAATSPRGAVGSTFGWLYMNEGSDITLNDGANLYAWGFVTGDGSITAHSGATVYEYFQINDFRGGTITANMATDSRLNQFPFNQYYVQNIESHLRIEHGASERVCLEIYAASQVVALDLEFIGGSDGMFVLEDEGTYLEKYYDYANDKMKYELGGSASISSIALSLAGITISSEAFYLPISNIDFTVKEGSTLTTNKDVIFLPGSSVTVEEGATVDIADGGSVVFAAKQDVTGYSASGGTLKNPCWPVIYTPTPHPTRTWATISEPYVDNNGTIIVEENATFAATSPAAAIYSSSGEGVLQMNGDNNTDDIVLTKYVSASTVNGQTVVNTNDVEPIPAVIQDEPGVSSDETTHSSDAIWGTPATFRKINGVYGDYREVTWIDLDNSVAKHEDLLSYDAYLELTDLPTPQQKPADEFGAYLIRGWKIDTVTLNAVTVVPDYELIPNEVTITWLNWDGSALEYSSTVFEYNEKPAYPGTGTKAPKRARTNAYTYTWWGWSDGENEYAKDNLPNATKNTTYTAVFAEELNEYQVYWLVRDPENPDDIDYDYYLFDDDVYITYGEQFEYTQPDPVLADCFGDDYADYVFAGWEINGEPYPLGTALPICEGSDDSDAYYECYAIFIQSGADSGKAYFDSHTISLDGSIGVNFYIVLPDGESADDYEVGCSFRGVSDENVSLADLYDDDHHAYKFTVYADAPQMTEDFTAILYKNGEIADISVFNVADYSAALNAADDAVINDEYYLVGTIGGVDCWTSNVQPKYKFTPNYNAPADLNEYMLQYVELSAGDEIKVVKKTASGYTYYPDASWGSATGNKVIPADGTYSIYFRPNGNGPDGDLTWFYNSIYIEEVRPLKKLVRALLSFGGAAQTYFADKEYAGTISDDNAADYIVDPEVYPDVTDQMLVDRLDAVGTDLTSGAVKTALAAYGLEYYGCSAVLNTNTSLRVYFRVTNDELYWSNRGSITFGFHNEAVDSERTSLTYAVQNDLGSDFVCLEYANIAAAELNSSAVMKVNGTTIFRFSVMDYLRKARNEAVDKGDETLMNLVKALYYYNLAADSYFNFAVA